MKSLTALFLICAFAFTALGAQADPGKGHGKATKAAAGNNGRHLGQLKHLKFATLPDSDIAFALNHQKEAMARLRSMRSIDYSRVRIVRLTAAQKARFHVSLVNGTQLAYEPSGVSDAQTVAQIFNSSSPIVQQLQQIVAGLLISNAINNALGGGGGGAASLGQVLGASGIPLSSLLGIFFDPSGILNAIVG